MRALRVAVLKQVDMDIQIVLIADFVFPIVRVGTVGRHKRRNRTHAILMPSENPFQTALFLQICMFPTRYAYGYGVPPSHTYALSCKRI